MGVAFVPILHPINRVLPCFLHKIPCSQDEPYRTRQPSSNPGEIMVELAFIRGLQLVEVDVIRIEGNNHMHEIQ